MTYITNSFYDGNSYIKILSTAELKLHLGNDMCTTSMKALISKELVERKT